MFVLKNFIVFLWTQFKNLEINSKNNKISSFFTFSNEIETIYYKGIPLNFYLEQVIIGLILGDGSLVKKYENGNAYFKYSHGVNQFEYLNFVFDLFVKAGYCTMNKPSKGLILNKQTGKNYIYYTFNSKSLKIFSSLYKIFYINKVKVIPENISVPKALLTPIGLAFWFMDDGNKTGKGLHLNTNAFSEKDLKLLLLVLKNKFDLDCSIHSRNRIYIKVKSVKNFVALVEPFIEESMKYKIKT
jgi:hypothetical protein